MDWHPPQAANGMHRHTHIKGPQATVICPLDHADALGVIVAAFVCLSKEDALPPPRKLGEALDTVSMFKSSLIGMVIRNMGPSNLQTNHSCGILTTQAARMCRDECIHRPGEATRACVVISSFSDTRRYDWLRTAFMRAPAAADR